jgi:Ni/Fe-hydrogenase subunit HybB-like protein
MVTYGYVMEAFMAWYSGNGFEQYVTLNRMFGRYAPWYWTLIACNCLAPQILWFKSMRQNVGVLFVVALLVGLGMWAERYVIVVISLHRDYLFSSWGMYYPTVWDWATYIGTIGLFLCLLFLFVRFLPMISIFEMRTLLPEAKVKEEVS